LTEPTDRSCERLRRLRRTRPAVPVGAPAQPLSRRGRDASLARHPAGRGRCGPGRYPGPDGMTAWTERGNQQNSGSPRQFLPAPGGPWTVRTPGPDGPGQSFELASRVGDKLTMFKTLPHLGIEAHAAGRLDATRERRGESTQLRRETGLLPGVAANLIGRLHRRRPATCQYGTAADTGEWVKPRPVPSKGFSG
jgi:hypothetical protein